MGRRVNYGGVYEIKLPNDKYVYVCLIKAYCFGVFDYYSEAPTNKIDNLLTRGFKIFKACKETAVRKKQWKLIGYANLEDNGIEWPDLASYCHSFSEDSIARSIVIRQGKHVRVEQDYFLELVKKGYTYGFFDRPEIFEMWLVEHIEDYPKNIKW